MSEEVVTFGPNDSLVGILHRPTGLAAPSAFPTVLLLNAGILHRVGPNRLYVQLARQLQECGYDVLRFDVMGIGDSQDRGGQGEGRTFVDDTRDAMEMLRQRLGAESFILMGICMGAQIALEVARHEPTVEQLVLMEGIYVKSTRYHISRILEPAKWKKVITGESHLVKKINNRIKSRLNRLLGRNGSKSADPATREPPPTSNGNLKLFFDKSRERNMKDTLRDVLGRGTKILLIFRDGNEIAYNYRLHRNGDDISASGLPGGLEVAFIPYADHTFTPMISQELLLKRTAKWMKEHQPEIQGAS